MKSKLLIFFLLLTSNVIGQQSAINIFCGSTDVNAFLHEKIPQAKAEHLEFNLKNQIYKNLYFSPLSTNEIVIPVVFHVYGTNFNGKSVSNELIQQALDMVNLEFRGLNDDFETVAEMFKPIRGVMNISYKLAQIDPNGNSTSGIVRYPAKGGYADHETMDAEVQADAWDNYSYMNVYIQSDLYGDGVTNNSGVAWYPSTYMSDRNLARVVYNGAYLGTNTSKEFASVLTHEFGHWLNLIHPFEGGCAGTDEVDDTPQEDGLHALGCSLGTNCDGIYINHENYMGYNGSHGCYKMFTEGQVARMNAALDHPAIKPLWQDQNLIETGLLDGTIYLPEINWITSRASYRQNNTEFASIIQEVILQIVDPVISHDIEIIKPNGSSIAITTLVGETYSMTLNDPGTWTIRIPAYRKEISKSIP